MVLWERIYICANSKEEIALDLFQSDIAQMWQGKTPWRSWLQTEKKNQEDQTG